MTRMRRHLSYANVASTLALIMALGGTAYAGATLARNSVGSAQLKRGGVANSDIRNNAVTSAKIRNRAIRAADLAPGVVRVGATGPTGPAGPAGPTGATGPTGAQGEAGTAAAFARVQADGNLLPALGDFPATSKNILSVSRAAPGVYCVDLAFRPASAMVALDNAAFNTAANNSFSVSVATERGNNINPCTGTDARVQTTRWTETAAPAFTDHPFVIWFEEG